MKVAKSYKFLILIVAFLLSMACALGFMNVATAHADKVNPDKYFVLKGANAQFDENGLNITAQDNDIITFKNDLIVNELTLKMKLPQDFTTAFIFDLDSFYVNGNPKEWSKRNTEGTEYHTTIKNIVKLSYASTTEVACKVNDVAIPNLALDTDGYLTLDIGVVGNYLTVAGFNIENSYDADQKIYYRLKNVDNKIVVKGLAFDFNTDTQGAQGEFILESVNQKRSDENYNQSLKLAESQTSLTPAYPRAYINEDFYLRNADGSYSAVKKAYNEKYKLTIKACSVLGGYSNLYLVNSTYDNILLESDTTMPNELRFKSAGSNVKFGIGEVKEVDGVKTTKVYEEINVAEVKSSSFEDVTTPVYTYDEVAYASYLNAIEKATTVEKEDGTITSVGLGTDFTLPSMKDFVSDDVVSYEKLTSKIYYRTLTDKQSTSTGAFKLNHIGNYIFFVSFSDGVNEIKESDFFTINNDGVQNNGIYGEDNTVVDYVGNYVFRFEIIDNADIEVAAAAKQGPGYKGVQYKASSFVVDAKGCTMEYKLYYNADLDADKNDANWVEIPKADDLTDELDKLFDNGVFDYEEVKMVAFDGELSFVPTKIGAYKIVCTATSSVSSRDASDTTIIRVESEPKVVEVPSKWLENNLWSVIFLSIGTLCLIGIIVLLFIKPKDQIEE